MRSPVRHGLIVTFVSLAGAMLVLANRIPRFSDALHTDETATLLMGEMQKSGGVMYRDLWNSHAPGLFMLTAMLPESVLRHEALFRLLSVAALVACVALLADLCVRAGLGVTATFMGMLVFTLLNCNNRLFSHYVQAEQFTALWLVAALWSLEAMENPFIAWLFFGVALLFKQSNIAWLPFVLAYDGWRLMRGRPLNFGAVMKRASVIIPGLALLVYFAAQHALGDLLQNVWTDALQHGASGSYCDAWHAPLTILARRDGPAQLFTLLCGLACCSAAAMLLDGSRLLRDRAVRLLGPAGVILAGGMVFLLIQRCGRIYYLEPLYPAVFLIAAWAVHWSIGLALQSGAFLRRAAGGGILLLLLAGIAVLATTYSLAAPANPWEQRLALDRYLARQLKIRFPLHTLYTAASQPAWYWYSGQAPPRFVWVSELLEHFPERREEIYRDAVDYGRGKKLLVLFYRGDLHPGSPAVLAYRDRLLRAGASPFMPADNRVEWLLSQNYEMYEWNLTHCGPMPDPCPSAGADVRPLN
jgi:hypothetical protein